MRRLPRLAAFLVAGGLALFGSTAFAQHTFQSNIFFQNANNWEPGANNSDILRLNFCNDEPAAGPLLLAPYAPTSGWAQGSWSPDFRPALGSVAVGGAGGCGIAAVDELSARQHQDATCACDPVVCPDFLEPVCFRGGVPPQGYGEDWTQGWTNFDYGYSDVPAGPVNVIPLGPGALSAANLNWTRTNGAGVRNVYVLRGRVRVTAGNNLNIQAGTYIVGSSADLGYLTVDVGATINALGTATDPIIFTSDQPNGLMGRSDWGGVVLHGDACANCANCTGGVQCISEGDAGEFCGNDDDDNKGTVRYARFEYCGLEVGLDNELNCLTMNAVGCKTTLEYLQAHMGFDDKFEWFGGTAQCRYLLATGGGDDGLDWQMGYRGQIQFAVVVYFDDDGDSGIEADNNENAFDAPCRSNPVVSNVTVIGRGPGAAAGGGSGMRIRNGTDAQIVNSIIQGWNNPGNWGLRVDELPTIARGVWPPTKTIDCDTPATIDNFELASGVAVRTYPNPATDRARFQFSMRTSGRAQMQIFDTSGRLVDTVLDGDLQAGAHELTWNIPADRPAGTYFYQLSGQDFQQTGRIITLD